MERPFDLTASRAIIQYYKDSKANKDASDISENIEEFVNKHEGFANWIKKNGGTS
jgi:hypothetical protein